MEEIVEPLHWEMTDSLEFTGAATAEDIERGEQFGRRFGEAVMAG
jgi:hypothetical protein